MENFERKLDDKNRLTIPVEVRPEFEGGQVILTKERDNTLALYSQEYWDKVIEPKLVGEYDDDESFKLNRRVRSAQSRMRLDSKQGRITLEQRFKDYAGIKKDVNAWRRTTTGGTYWILEAA